MIVEVLAGYRPPLIEGDLIPLWSSRLIRFHGCTIEARETVYPGRRALAGNWPHTPETCCGRHGNLWMFENQVLVCQGCGLDGT